MTAVVYQLRDYHLKKLERDAKSILGQVVAMAKEGGPIVDGAIPTVDPWEGRHCPGGIDDLA